MLRDASVGLSDVTAMHGKRGINMVSDLVVSNLNKKMILQPTN